jgi:CRISPR-associated protein Csm4
MIYKFTIAPKGAMGTPLRSDTLFGHACWTLRLHESRDRFTAFMSNAKAQKPELIFSDGFPSGWLPRPLVPVIMDKSSNRELYSVYKQAVKRSWVSMQYAEVCSWNILECALKSARDNAYSYSDNPETEAVLHNVIDRVTGTSLDKHGLFSTDKQWYHGIWKEIDIYVSTEWDKEYLAQFIDTLFAIGYGRDQSVGLGSVKIVNKPEIVIFPKRSTTIFLSLSRTIPCANVNIDASYYQIETKYGKVWSGLEQQKSPFKKPMLQMVPGSVLKCSANTVVAGSIVTGIHDNEEVIENCMTILYPLPETIMEGVPL